VTLELTVGDTSPTLTGKVNANLTAAQGIAVHIRRPDATVLTKTAAAVGAPANGDWIAEVWAVGDLSVPGIHKVETQVTFADGKVQTFVDDTQGVPAEFFVRNQYA